MIWRRLQAWVLGLVGATEILAFPAVLVPQSSMATIHDWLGVGEMPRAPVFDSLMRRVAFTYGLHGVALLFIASDVVRYRPLVVLTAVGYLASGLAFIAIDVANGMPWWWVANIGGCCLLIGVVLLALMAVERNTGEKAK
ncbi:MAG TPA: hypothetical protein VL371_16495 [Gemmataceae bacterium]|nr:hypothetical protein [Gemmataceae bacterium]